MNALALYNHYARTTFAILAFVCAASVFLYGFFLLEAVAHTASRAQASHALVELKSKLSDLESTYLSATQTLTPALASSMGLVAPKAVATIYATNNGTALTLQTLAQPEVR